MNGNGNGRQSWNLIAAHVLVAITAIVCGTILASLGHINQEAVVTLFGAAIGLTGGAAGAIVTGRYGLPSGSTIVTPSNAEHTTTVTTDRKENVS